MDLSIIIYILTINYKYRETDSGNIGCAIYWNNNFTSVDLEYVCMYVHMYVCIYPAHAHMLQ
jgi:hypothetical protein